MNKTWLRLAIAGISFCWTLAWAAPPQDFSHVSVVKNADGTTAQFINVHLRDGKKLRVEFLAADRSVLAISIYRKDKELTWGVEPDSKTYVQKKLDAGTWDRGLFSVFPEPGQTFIKTGEATHLGFACDVLASELKKISTVNAVVRDMNVIMKSDMLLKGKVVQVIETTEFRLEKPPATLFELPAGYKRRAIVE